MRNNVVRRNKKKSTRKKKIIRNYRKLKNEAEFKQDQVSNVILNKEFLDLLNRHINQDFLINSDSEKRIFFLKIFTEKKNRNKIWDKMRDCIKGAIEIKDGVIKNSAENADENKEKEEVQTKKKSGNSSLVIENRTKERDNIEKHLLNENNTKTIRNISAGERNREIIKQFDGSVIKGNNLNLGQINRAKDHVICKNHTSEGNSSNIDIDNIALDKETSPVIPEDNTDSQIFESRRQKRLKKKKQRKLKVNLNETIVMNKTKAEGDAIQNADDRLDLLDIVDVVAKEEDIQRLHSAKLQIHSRSFRP